jgi:hypothetical protein
VTADGLELVTRSWTPRFSRFRSVLEEIILPEFNPLTVTVPNIKGWFSTYLGYPSEASNLRGVVFGTLNTLAYVGRSVLLKVKSVKCTKKDLAHTAKYRRVSRVRRNHP